MIRVYMPHEAANLPSEPCRASSDDGEPRKPDHRDEALEDLRKQNGKLRQEIERKDAEIAQWTARIKELEKRQRRIAEIVEGK